MKEKEMAKYAVVVGAVFLLAGVSIQNVPAFQGAGDIVVDGTPPASNLCNPPPSTTKDNPRMTDHEQGIPTRGSLAFGTIQLNDDTSGIDVSTMSIICTNVTKGTTVYSKSWGEFDESYGSDGDTNSVYASEYTKNYFSDSDGDGNYEFPQGDKFKFEMSAKDMAGNKFSGTGWYQVKIGAPSGNWYIDGQGWSAVKYVSNELTFKFEATKNSQNVSTVKVDIDKRDNTDVKEVTLSETATDTWTGSTTLSDGKYMVKGILSSSAFSGEEIVAQRYMGVNSEKTDYIGWLTYALMGVGLVSMIGGSWKLISLV